MNNCKLFFISLKLKIEYDYIKIYNNIIQVEDRIMGKTKIYF